MITRVTAEPSIKPTDASEFEKAPTKLSPSKNPPEYYKPKDAGGYDTFCFNKNNFENGNTPTVYVLPGCKSRYNNTSNPFWNCNFVEMSDAMVGIESVDNDENLIGKVYNLNGQRQRKMQKGINIIRFLDGTTKKVLVK